MSATIKQVEMLRRILTGPGVQQRLAVLRDQIRDAEERDRRGLPPVPTGDSFRDRMIADHVARLREGEGR